MADLFVIFAAAFGEAAPKAFQQRNVMGLHYAAIPVTGVVMNIFRYYAMYLVVSDITLVKVLVASVGAALGAMLSMWLHVKVFGNNRGERH